MEEEGGGGKGGACGGAVFLVDDLTEAVEGHFAATYLEEGAGDGADHVAQEAVGGYLEVVAGGVGRICLPTGRGDVADVGLDIGMEFGEGGEVVNFQKNFCRLVHQVEIDFGGYLQTVGIEEWGPTDVNIVAIGAVDCIEAGMGIVGDREKVVESDVEWVDNAVERGEEPVFVGDGGGVEMGNHHGGIDTGIGATCAYEADRVTEEKREAVLDFLLDRDGARLTLPAMVVKSVIG